MAGMKRFVVLLFVAASSGSWPLPAPESAPLVAAPAGRLQGTAVGGIHVFKGIPYALQPMRWKPPAPAPIWKNTREATEFGFVCVQPKPQPASIYSWDPKPMSEDCLSLKHLGAGRRGQGAGILLDPRRRALERLGQRCDSVRA